MQKKRRSITGGGVVGRLHKDGGHACTERRGRDLGHRADKVLIRLSDVACGRRVQIDTCQGVDICSTQLALPGASTLVLFVVVSPYGEEVVLHIHHEQCRRVSHSHDSPSRAPAPWRRCASQSGLYGMRRISLEPLLYRRCPAQCNPRIVHVYLPALMYTAGAPASAQGEALPTKQVIFPAGESRVDGTRRSLCHTRVHGPLHRCHAASPCRRRRGHRGREEVGTMQFGVMLPHRWLYAAGNTIADFAREAEALGYTSLWVTDHIIVPSYRTERGHIFYEALMTLAYVSSITTRCRLGVAVLALPPERRAGGQAGGHPGRPVPGSGAPRGGHWLDRGRIAIPRSRMAAAGPHARRSHSGAQDPLERRGANSFAGRYTTFTDIACFPKPAWPVARRC